LFRRIPCSSEWVLEHSFPWLSEATRGLQGHPEPSRWRAVDVIAGGTRVLFGCADKPVEKQCWLICCERKILFRLKKQAEKDG
jgi:hypothetical protein